MLTPPRRLFHIPSMSTAIYEDVVDDITNKGYIAVSHVWGDQQMYTADELGINNGVDWEIPLSNPNKIRRLVDAMNHYEKEYCWFDILCMPQDKQHEVNSEIPFMGDYYSGADITIVLSDTEYVVSEDLTRWQNMMLNVMGAQREFTSEERRWITGNSKCLLDISEDDWFERVWTLQETVLSKKVIYTGPNGSHLRLTDIFLMVSYMTSKHVLYTQILFGDNLSAKLIGLGQALTGHNRKTLDLMRALSTVLERNCKRIHDRFYGLFGILGYKDFVVNYDISMKDLNKEIVKHAYSKGDLSWMTVEKGIRTGFIQPIYGEYSCFGTAWRTKGGITLVGDNLHMDVTTFGRVVYRATFVDDNLDVDLFVKWVVDVFRRWEFDDATIFRTITGYYDMSDEYTEIGVTVLDHIAKSPRMEPMSDDMHVHYVKVMENIRMIYMTSEIRFIVGVELPYGEGFYPLMISGGVDPLDEIVVPKVVDCRNRRLGIVTSRSHKRKGVCFIPPEDTNGSCAYVPYTFPL